MQFEADGPQLQSVWSSGRVRTCCGLQGVVSPGSKAAVLQTYFGGPVCIDVQLRVSSCTASAVNAQDSVLSWVTVPFYGLVTSDAACWGLWSQASHVPENLVLDEDLTADQ